jgi:hypothetical protein
VRCEGSGELHALGASLLKKETSVSIDRNLGQAQSKPECGDGNEPIPENAAKCIQVTKPIAKILF